MTLEQARKVVKLINETYYTATIYEDYSGRGMNGKTCVGIVTDASPTLIGWACGVFSVSFKDTPSRTDSLGNGTIVY